MLNKDMMVTLLDFEFSLVNMKIIPEKYVVCHTLNLRHFVIYSEA